MRGFFSSPRFPVFLLVIAIGVHAGLMLYWIHVDQSVGRPAVAEMLWHVSSLVHAEADGSLGRVARDVQPGWIIWAALGLRHLFGTHPDCLLWLVLIFLVGAQVALFDLGRSLAGPWAGLAMAALFPLYPDVAVMARRWTPHVPHYFCLAAAAACLIRSRSFSRPLPTLGFLLFAALGVDLSPMSTDNMSYLPAIGAMALGAGLRGLVLGQDPLQGRVARWKPLVLGAVTATLLGLVVWHNGMFQQDAAYIQSEMASPTFERYHDRWSLPALTAYVRYLYHLGVSPILFVPFLAGLVLYVRRGPARAELLSWFFLPLAAFSVVSKKHPNYVFAVLPVVPVITVLGLWTLRSRRLAAALLASLWVLAGVQWFNRSFPAPTRPLAGWLGPYDFMPDMRQVFELEFIPDLEPQTTFRHAREARLLYRNMTALGCSASNLVQILFPGDFQDVRFILTARNPCVDVAAWPDVSRIEIARWVLVADPACTLRADDRAAPAGDRAGDGEETPWESAAKQVMSGGGYLLLEQDTSADPCLYLFARKPGAPRSSPLPGPVRAGHQ